MPYCQICNKTIAEPNIIILRNNISVCKMCIYDDNIKLLNTKIYDTKRNIKKLELWIEQPSRSEQSFFSSCFNQNNWDFTGALICLFTGISYLIQRILFSVSHKEADSMTGFLFIITVMTFTILKFYKDYKLRNKFKIDLEKSISELKLLEAERDNYYEKLRPYFDQLWEIPPDWEWRRQRVYNRENGKCEKCGKHLTKSYDIHHIIPKQEKKGSHSLNNLQLLCRECHSKIDTKGHSLLR